MATKQINLKMQENLYILAEKFAVQYGFRNIQDLITASLREKIFERDKYDETFSEQEIKLIDELIAKSIKAKKLHSEERLNKAL